MKTGTKLVVGSAILFYLIGMSVRTYHTPTESMSPAYHAGSSVFVSSMAYGLGTKSLVPLIGSLFPHYRLVTWAHPQRYDVIAYQWPGHRDDVEPSSDEIYMKRCLGLPGDTVHVVRGVPYVNGIRHDRYTYVAPKIIADSARIEQMRYSMFPPNASNTAAEWGPMRVPAEGDTLHVGGGLLDAWSTFIAREGHAVNVDARTIDGMKATTYVVENDYLFVMGDNSMNSVDSRFTGFVNEHLVIGRVFASIDGERN